jgi:XTP/dITP diphosphohydrolase
MKLYIGTTNTNKIAEIASLLQPLDVYIVPISRDIPEIYNTFEENSELKTKEYAKHTLGLCLSEDSGLEIDALGGKPGAHSARYYYQENPELYDAGLTRKEIDHKNNLLVLDQMKGIENRSARFVVVFTLCNPEKVLFQTKATYDGFISENLFGKYGFGYDPIFVGHNTFGRTLAELDPMRKNLISHRQKALNAVYEYLKDNMGKL